MKISILFFFILLIICNCTTRKKKTGKYGRVCFQLECVMKNTYMNSKKGDLLPQDSLNKIQDLIYFLESKTGNKGRSKDISGLFIYSYENYLKDKTNWCE